MFFNYFFSTLYTVRGAQIPHITQTAGQEVSSGVVFNRYIIPKVPIAPSAERASKISLINDAEILVQCVSVESDPLRQGLNGFTWLCRFQHVVLDAHYCTYNNMSVIRLNSLHQQ